MMNNEQRLDDEALLWELYFLNNLIISIGPSTFLMTLRTEDFLQTCEMGSYGSVT